MAAADNSQLPKAYSLAGQQQSEVAEYLPHCLFLETTNRCNLRCITCPHSFARLEPPQTLDFDGFLRVVEQFPYIQRAVLHGIGEPLLNPGLPLMISHLKRLGSSVLFNTNGLLLDEERSRAVIDSGLDELRVSVDAATPDSYTSIRGLPHFADLVSNLERFCRLQRESRRPTPRVSLWLTGMRRNVTELAGLVELAARIGVPEVYMQRMVYYLDTSRPAGLLEGSQALAPDDPAVEAAIGEAEEAAQRLGVVLHASGATDPRGSMAALDSPAARPWAACARPWTTAYVTANGNCLPCCMGPFATERYDDLVMGNIFEEPFGEVWNGERYRSWRSSMLWGDAPTPCTGCGVYWSL